MNAGRRLWPILLSTALAFTLLCGLGVWQLQRLAWKQALIAGIEQHMAAEALPLAATRLLDGSATSIAEYQKFKLSGHFSVQPPLRLIATLAGGPGWRLLHPFETSDGARLLVDRGIAGEDQIAGVPQGVVQIIGLVRHHSQGQGAFDPANDAAANLWYWWDWPAMLAALPPSPMPTATFALDLLPGEPGTEGLFVAPPKSTLSNNHLGYAITWFGFAAALLCVATLFARGRIKKSAA